MPPDTKKKPTGGKTPPPTEPIPPPADKTGTEVKDVPGTISTTDPVVKAATLSTALTPEANAAVARTIAASEIKNPTAVRDPTLVKGKAKKAGATLSAANYLGGSYSW